MEVIMELMKCPFCQSEAKVGVDKSAFDFCLSEHGHAAVEIECTNPDCGCQFWTYSNQHESSDYETAVKVAIERWNKRAEVKESESL
jgi:hypothetical protein